jgi:5-methylcytosine-specific restriction endonuclease McrA
VKRKRKTKRKQIYHRDNHRCQYCGRKVSFNVEPDNAAYPTIDHIIPISRNGHRTSEVNLCVACILCNNLKADRMPWEIEMWPLNGLGGCFAGQEPPDAQ